MGFRKELNKIITRKFGISCLRLQIPGNTDVKGGCGPIAVDGLIRGVLPQEAYDHCLKRGGGTDVQNLVKQLHEISNGSPVIGLRYYSSARGPLGVEIETEPLSHREAEALAQRLRDGVSAGVITIMGPREQCHIASQIGNKGAIIAIDSVKKPQVREVTFSETVRVLRRTQRRGIVIELRRLNP